MDSMLVVGVVVSFLFAFFGYIIVSFWIRPIWTYKRLKKAVADDMTMFLDSVKDETSDSQAENLRQYASALMESYSVSLPVWYKLVIQNRGESVEDAAGHLMGLSNTRNYDHARKRMDKIREALKI